MLLGLSTALCAQPTGGLEAKAEAGRLVAVESWWSPQEDWEGRWWWSETGGSAWVRLGAWQAGPLTVTSAGEGWRRWSRGTELSSGHWGVGVDQDAWGLWAVQDPERLDAGAQARLSVEPWVVALGGERRWDLQPGASTWLDTLRSGLVFETGTLRAGLEATAVVPVAEPVGWWGRGSVKASAWGSSASLEGSGSWCVDERAPWDASAALTGGGWSARWAAQADDPWGAASLGWKGRGAGASASWGPQQGAEFDARVELLLSDVTLELQEKVETPPVVASGEIALSGRAAGGRWVGSWALAPEEGEVSHVVKGSWHTRNLEVEAQWSTQGWKLGWIGPGIAFDLTVRWLF